MKQAFKELKNFIKETDKILLLLCMLASAFGCLSVMSATKWTVGDGGMLSRDSIVMAAAVCAGIIIALIISIIDVDTAPDLSLAKVAVSVLLCFYCL